MARIPVLIFTALLLLVPSLPCGAKQPIVIGMPQIDGGQKTMPQIEAMLREAYRRIGETVTFRYYPMLREINEADDSYISASGGRTGLALRDRPDLVKVPTPLARTEVRAYTVEPDIDITAWGDLARYKTGYLRGDETSTISLADAGVTGVAFGSLNAALKSLRQGRIDILVTHAPYMPLTDLTAETSSLHASEPLYTGWWYHALNTSHADLANKLAKALEDMLKDGTSARLLGKYAYLLPDAPPAKPGRGTEGQ